MSNPIPTELTTATVHEYLIECFPDATLDLIDEYMDESEHQDGEECWTNNFSTMHEVVEDFLLYCCYDGGDE